MDDFCRTWSPRLLSALRIMTALLFLQHGTAKFFGFPHVAYFDNLEFMSLLGAAGVLELVGGVLILIGLFTRPVAFVLSGFMPISWATHRRASIQYSTRVNSRSCSASSSCISRPPAAA